MMAGTCSSASPALRCLLNARPESRSYKIVPSWISRNSRQHVGVHTSCENASSQLLARCDAPGRKVGARFMCVNVANLSARKGGYLSSRHPVGLGWKVTCALPAGSAQAQEDGEFLTIGRVVGIHGIVGVGRVFWPSKAG